MNSIRVRVLLTLLGMLAVVALVMGSLAYAAGPLGLVVAGPLADAAGLHVTFLALSLPMLLLGAVAIFLPALRHLDRAPSTST